MSITPADLYVRSSNYVLLRTGSVVLLGADMDILWLIM